MFRLNKANTQAHTFASHTQPTHRPKLAKVYAFCQRSTDRQPKRPKKGQQITAPTKNWRFSASYDSLVVQQTFVLRMNICGEIRQLLVAANR